MNIKNFALLLLLCIPNISKCEAAPTEEISTHSDDELKQAEEAWHATPEYQAVDFACKASVKSGCSKRPYGDSEECQELLNAIKCFDRYSKSTPEYRKYNELREIRDKKESAKFREPQQTAPMYDGNSRNRYNAWY